MWWVFEIARGILQWIIGAILFLALMFFIAVLPLLLIDKYLIDINSLPGILAGFFSVAYCLGVIFAFRLVMELIDSID